MRASLPHVACGLLWLTLASCSSAARTGPEPEVALATSADAQAQFRALHEQWVSSPLDARLALERPLTQFVQRHPSDPRGRWARIYLAWISLQRGQLEVAERWLALAEPGAAGAATDLREVVAASLQLAHGHAEDAYRKLLLLEGRLIDSDDRLLCLDQLVLAAQASAHFREAVTHMLELAVQAARRHRERMWRLLEPRLASIPLPVLEASLPTLSTSISQSPSVRPAERAAAVEWMRRQILQLLSRSALTQQDVELAQRLVATPAAGSSNEAEKSELLLLATQGGLAPTILGRTLGLALQLGEPSLTQRSIDVASGVAVSLELLATEQRGGEIVLQTRDVQGAGMGATLARLASDGATLLAAGLDPSSARAAANFAAERGIPVLLLHEPEDNGTKLPASAYVIGAADAQVNQVLLSALQRRTDEVIAVGSPESPCPGDDDKLLARLGVLDGSTRRYGLAFEGSADCARGVLAELGGSTRRWTIGLGLNALLALDGGLSSAHEVWAVGAGRLPYFEGSRDAELAAWFERKGRAPGWYEALGRDVARFAQSALPASPATPVVDPESVARMQRRVSAGLVAAKLPQLWTSDADAFDAERHLPREFRALRVNPSVERRPR
jgi:hypothetical protein